MALRPPQAQRESASACISLESPATATSDIGKGTSVNSPATMGASGKWMAPRGSTFISQKVTPGAAAAFRRPSVTASDLRV
jgi:hypothetical protein